MSVRILKTMLALVPGLAHPALAQRAPVSLECVTEIGCLDCTGAEAFGSIVALSIGRGRVVVADRDEPHLRIFDLEGRRLAAIGPEGDGPGELRAPLEVSAASGGTAVLDLRRLRLAVLADHGTESAGVRLAGYPVAAAFAPGGSRMYGVLTELGSARVRVSEWMPARDARVVADSLPGFVLGSGPPPVLSLARAPDGAFVLGEGAERYRLLFFGAEGRLRRELVRDVARVRKSRTEIEDERARRRRGGGAPSPGGERQASAPGASDIDPLRVHFRGQALRFDETGRLWVRTERGQGVTVFDLFDSGGGYLGSVTVPGRVDAFALGDGHLAGEVQDDLGVSSVRIWRITLPQG